MKIEGVEFSKAILGVDGDCGFALIGPDLQMGEAEFVQVECKPLNGDEAGKLELLYIAQVRACWQALVKLRARLNLPKLDYEFGRSHPYHSDNIMDN